MNFRTSLIATRSTHRGITLAILASAGLALMAAPAWAQGKPDKPGSTKAAEDLQCIECVELEELKSDSVDGSCE